MPGRKDGNHCTGPGQRIDAVLHHSVATPHEQDLSAMRAGTAGNLRSFAALSHLIPLRVVDTLRRQSFPEAGQTAAETLT